MSDKELAEGFYDWWVGSGRRAEYDVLAEQAAYIAWIEARRSTPQAHEPDGAGEPVVAASEVDAYEEDVPKWLRNKDYCQWPACHCAIKCDETATPQQPKDRRSDYVKAASLLLAEVERLDRAAAPEGK